MYTPAHFKEERVPVLHEAIARLAFGTLVTTGASGLDANHLPMLISPTPEPCGTLRGHVARANPQWKNTPAGAQALAMFVGPNAYISPAWYPSKAQTGKVVPTWNYLAVHAYGEIEFFEDPARLREIVSDLTDVHERTRAAPWAVTDAPADYIDQMLRAIVGFTLKITRLEGKWKMSQNRAGEDIAGVLQGLAADGSPDQLSIRDVMAELKT